MSRMFDPVHQDPPLFDQRHPPSMEVLHIPAADGHKMNGVLYKAQGAGKHPLVVLLHGFPGNERNTDVAQALRRAGYHVLMFHYRGAWGSKGTFSFSNVLVDTRFVLDYALGLPITEPTRVALLGHSMGGWAALMTAAQQVSDKLHQDYAVGAFGVWNVGLFGERVTDELYDTALGWIKDSSAPLQCVPHELLDALRANHLLWNLTWQASKLSGRDVLLIGASEDEDCPAVLHHTPVANLYAKTTKLTQVLIPNADHVFSGHRIVLIHEIIRWLDDLFKPLGR
jgi:uncharacterized protein